LHAKQVPNTQTTYIQTIGIRKNPIQLGTFLEFLNEVMHKDISLDKDLYAYVNIMKSPLIVG
jgi:hypothetical protein